MTRVTFVYVVKFWSQVVLKDSFKLNVAGGNRCGNSIQITKPTDKGPLVGVTRMGLSLTCIWMLIMIAM